MQNFIVWVVLVLSTINSFYFISTAYYQGYDHFMSINPGIKQLKYRLSYLNSVITVDNQYYVAINRIKSIIQTKGGVAQEVEDSVAKEIYLANLKYSINVNLICALITQESYWDIFATSYRGAGGLMQIMPPTGMELCKELNIPWKGYVTLYDPVLNIKIGTYYLYKLINKYGIKGALVAYNGGHGGWLYWQRTGVMFEETQGYVPRIYSFLNQFKSINL